jgi:hypothetical protein
MINEGGISRLLQYLARTNAVEQEEVLVCILILPEASCCQCPLDSCTLEQLDPIIAIINAVVINDFAC